MDEKMTSSVKDKMQAQGIRHLFSQKKIKSGCCISGS
jgi:hypothetical protein